MARLRVISQGGSLAVSSFDQTPLKDCGIMFRGEEGT
jgi:hypothetical protein